MHGRTYKGADSVVVVNVEAGNITHCDLDDNEIFRHLLSIGKGRPIKKAAHARDKKHAIDQMIDQL